MARRDVLIRSPEVAGLTIAEENALAGDPLPTIAGAGSTSTLHGFAREFSIQAGETQEFSCHGTTASAIDIYRVGYYGGDGARLVDTVANTGTSQASPTTIANSNSATTCTGWSVTAEWDVPADATSGLYVGVLRNSGSSALFWVPFVVRRDDRPADVMYKTSDTTWALAYNGYGTPAAPITGGKSLYGTGVGVGNEVGISSRAHATTYHKPIVTRQGVAATYWTACELPLILWLERNGFDVTYTASKDWREGASAPTPAECNVYISPGHDEYWSVGMRDRWEALRDTGKHLLFMSGNEVFWRTRFPDDQGDVMWCFKDTMAGPGGHAAGAALDPVTWTGTWRDTRAANAATREPENLITGTTFRMNGVNYRTLSMSSSDPETDHVFWRGTTVPASGISVARVIGFEADEMNPDQPAGSRSVLASTSISTNGIYADNNGEDYGGTTSPVEWGVVAQRYASGALVVGFGTCQWSWGLGPNELQPDSSNTAMRQATLNLLVDLGAVPETPMSGLTVPSPESLDEYGLVP
jgi:hypothetical protein